MNFSWSLCFATTRWALSSRSSRLALSVCRRWSFHVSLLFGISILSCKDVNGYTIRHMSSAKLGSGVCAKCGSCVCGMPAGHDRSGIEFACKEFWCTRRKWRCSMVPSGSKSFWHRLNADRQVLKGIADQSRAAVKEMRAALRLTVSCTLYHSCA